MRVLVQVCEDAKVCVEGEIVGNAKKGLLLFIGFTEGDSQKEIEYLVQKVLHLRIFPDQNQVMNQSILDIKGEILSVSQFTLYADAKKGNRPSYKNALKSDEASVLFQNFNKELKKFIKVETGIFGADMKVSFTNVGPTTIWLEK